MSYSVVIPTRDRRDELISLLTSLESQTLLPAEIIVVDAGFPPLQANSLSSSKLPVRHMTASPSVCRQRNIGISAASSEFVFLCDDDIDLPPSYAETIITFMRLHPDHPIVSGTITERWNKERVDAFPPISLAGLLWNAIFSLSIWADLDANSSFAESIIRKSVRIWIGRTGNSLSLAGWPRLTRIDHPFFRTKVYGLGASILRRAAINDHPYDEILDEFGIGDHYGLAMSLAGEHPITVLPEISALHKRSPAGRISASRAAFRRILALDYFRHPISPRPTVERLALLWSLVGLALSALLRLDLRHVKAVATAGWLIVRDSNPYTEARRRLSAGPINPTFSETSLHFRA